MNFLEGCKRLFILFSLAVLAIVALDAWNARSWRAPPYSIGEAILQGFTEAEIAEQISRQSGYNLASARAAGYTDTAVILEITKAVHSPGSTKSEADLFNGMNTKPHTSTELAGIAAIVASHMLFAALILVAVWLVFRWIIVGFFPSQAVKR